MVKQCTICRIGVPRQGKQGCIIRHTAAGYLRCKQLTRPGRRPQSLTGWAGPWPVEERWWDPARHRRRARFQLVDDTGTANLVAVEAGRWWLEAVYA